MPDTLVRKNFFRMLVPTILTNLLSAVGAFSDTVIVGNIMGEAALSAVTFTSPVFMFINTIAIIFAVGGATAMNIDMGRGDRDSVNKIFTTAISTVTLLGFLLGIVCVIFIDGIVKILGANAETYQYVKEYAVVILGGFPVVLYNTCIAFYVRSDGRARLSMFGMLIAILANIVLDLVLVPIIGIAGAAWALVIAQGLSAVIISMHFFSEKNTLSFVPKGISPGQVLRVLKSGASTSLTFSCQFFVILIFNNLIVSISGTEGMVIYTVIYNISVVALAIFEGMSQTIQPMVSVYHGEKNSSLMRQTMCIAYKTAAVICGTVILLLEFFPQPFARLFGVTDPAILEGAVVATRIYAPAILLMTYNVLMSYFYQSTEKRLLSAMIVLCRCLVALLACALLFTVFWGLNGVWLGYLTAEILTLLLWLSMSALQAGKKGLSRFLLLKKQGPVFIRSFTGTLQNLSHTHLQAKAYLQKNGVDANKANKALLAVDKLVTNIMEHGGNKKRCSIEVYIAQEPETLRVIIRDDGKSFDPAVFKSNGAKQEEKDLCLVKEQAVFFEYRPTLGFNRTMLKY